MARVTVEDCVRVVPNRFDLVLLASQRSREIAAGAALTVDRDHDKNPVVALREIAEQSVALDNLEETIIHGFQRQLSIEDSAEELTEITIDENAYAGEVAHRQELEDMEIDGEDTAAAEAEDEDDLDVEIFEDIDAEEE